MVKTLVIYYYVAGTPNINETASSYRKVHVCRLREPDRRHDGDEGYL